MWCLCRACAVFLCRHVSVQVVLWALTGRTCDEDLRCYHIHGWESALGAFLRQYLSVCCVFVFEFASVSVAAASISVDLSLYVFAFVSSLTVYVSLCVCVFSL